MFEVDGARVGHLHIVPVYERLQLLDDVHRVAGGSRQYVLAQLLEQRQSLRRCPLRGVARGLDHVQQKVPGLFGRPGLYLKPLENSGVEEGQPVFRRSEEASLKPERIAVAPFEEEEGAKRHGACVA